MYVQGSHYKYVYKVSHCMWTTCDQSKHVYKVSHCKCMYKVVTISMCTRSVTVCEHPVIRVSMCTRSVTVSVCTRSVIISVCTRSVTVSVCARSVTVCGQTSQTTGKLEPSKVLSLPTVRELQQAPGDNMRKQTKAETECCLYIYLWFFFGG